LDSLAPVSGRLIFADLKSVPSKINPGKTAFIDAPITFLSGKGLIAKEHVYIVARNLGVERARDSRLLISNDPEEIEGEAVLLNETLSRDDPVRLLYYHKSGARKRFQLKLLVSNSNSYPVDLFISKGIGGPSPDGIYAGHVATRRFLRQENANAGRIIKIKPGEAVFVAEQEVKEAEISTGIIRLRLLSGGDVRLKLFAVKNGSVIPKNLASFPLKEDGRLSGTIGGAQIDVKGTFSFGQAPLDVRIGEGPTFIPDKGGFDIHLGNYGILHKINVDIKNSSAKDRRASLFYVATGGPARGTFIINGLLFETGLLDPKGNKSEKITSISVPAKGSTSLSIYMMPEPGSFYPTRLVVLEEKS
jgi:hypothetical protein